MATGFRVREKDIVLNLRVSAQERDAMREMAKCLNFMKPSGEPNVGEYLRNCHRVALMMYEDGSLRPALPVEIVEKSFEGG